MGGDQTAAMWTRPTSPALYRAGVSLLTPWMASRCGDLQVRPGPAKGNRCRFGLRVVPSLWAPLGSADRQGSITRMNRSACGFVTSQSKRATGRYLKALVPALVSTMWPVSIEARSGSPSVYESQEHNGRFARSETVRCSWLHVKPKARSRVELFTVRDEFQPTFDDLNDG
jgi:hypothetical protein